MSIFRPCLALLVRFIKIPHYFNFETPIGATTKTDLRTGINSNVDQLKNTFHPKLDIHPFIVSVLFFIYMKDTKPNEKKTPKVICIHKDDDNNTRSSEKRSTRGNKKGFRERKIILYENRLREYSTPDKLFRYFATIRLITPNGSIICMTPNDFLRSLYPGMRQPESLGLDRYKTIDAETIDFDKLNLQLNRNSIFYKLGSHGLITFSDYIFLLTVLSTSRRNFEIAFKMFDINGDGTVDGKEFIMVANVTMQQSNISTRQRDKFTNTQFRGTHSALQAYFFGKNLDKKLTIQEFLGFQRQLQNEILSMEFQRKKPNEYGRISEAQFAKLLLAYADMNVKKKSRKLKHVKAEFRNDIGISKKDYLDFFHFLNNINDVDTALTFYNIAGSSIDKATFKHVAKTVAMVEMSDHVIDVVFAIFDDNNDNQLSNNEFVAVMKHRIQRGLEKPKNTRFLQTIRAVIKCARETI